MAGRDRYLPATISSSSTRITESQFLESERNRSRSLILEDRIAIQHREIQNLLTDNQKLAVAHVGLKDQLNLAKRELQLQLETAAKVKAESEAKVREFYQDALRMEAQARVVDGHGADLDRVRADVEKLAANKKDLETELEMLGGELAKAKPNSERAVVVKKEVEVLREEVCKGRAAFEVEMKTRASNVYHERGMEKTIDHLNREIVKLREELANVEAKNGGAPKPPSSGNSDDKYGGQRQQYPEANGTHQVYGA